MAWVYGKKIKVFGRKQQETKMGRMSRYAGPQRPFLLQCGVVEPLKELQKREELKL